MLEEPDSDRFVFVERPLLGINEIMCYLLLPIGMAHLILGVTFIVEYLRGFRIVTFRSGFFAFCLPRPFC